MVGRGKARVIVMENVGKQVEGREGDVGRVYEDKEETVGQSN